MYRVGQKTTVLQSSTPVHNDIERRSIHQMC